jgi:uncharacterized protein
MHRWGEACPLGDMHRDGHGGLAKNDVEAVRHYRLSAEAENPFAMCNLGNMIMHDRGVGRDATEAERWLRRAAERGKTTGVKCELWRKLTLHS